MAKIKFLENAWNEYLYWQTEDKKSLKKINSLLKDISRDYYTGLGKPEPLKHNLKSLWSRRIDDKNRLIYYIDDDTIIVIKCKGDYEDKSRPPVQRMACSNPIRVYCLLCLKAY